MAQWKFVEFLNTLLLSNQVNSLARIITWTWCKVMKNKFFGLSDKDKTEIVSEAVRNANFTQWLKMKLYYLDVENCSDSQLDDLAAEIVDYLK